MLGLVRPFRTIFDDLPDHRRAQPKRHSLVAVFAVVTLALINQQNSLRQIAKWAEGLNVQQAMSLIGLPLDSRQNDTALLLKRDLDFWVDSR